MPADESRDRSASPAREPKAKKAKASGGFRWKEKGARNEGEQDRGSGVLERSYRDRSPRRESYRDRSPRRDDHRDNIRDTADARGEDRRDRDSDHGADSYRPSRKDDDISQPANTDSKDVVDQASTEKPDRPKKEKKEKKEKKASKPVSNEPMIIVNINDRLGTKAAIPCLASDSIKAFKAVVAAHIGRQPHEIMVKRQGERPFKDMLTLADYGVSNGVQLDLELDTGD